MPELRETACRRALRAPRRLVANLGWEAELAGESPGRTARATAAAFGTLLRTLAHPRDVLFLEAPVASGRVPALDWLPSPRLEHGSLSSLHPTSRILAWAESASVAEARRSSKALADSRENESEASQRITLAERLWEAEVPSPRAAANVHHRAFFFELAGRLGCRLPGSALVSSLEELERRLLDPVFGRAETWVLKAPWSAAGRHRVLGCGDQLEPTTRSVATRLLRRQSPLLLEPWVDRELDFGVSLLVFHDRVEVLSAHRQRVDARGVFRGLELCPSRTLEAWLSAESTAEVLDVVSAVGNAARAAGYRGPLGVDGFLFLRDGELHCQPLGEINARMTFGILGRALVEALPEDCRRDHERCRLWLGAEPPEPGGQGVGESVGSRRRIHLLRPGPEAPGAAWLDFVPEKRPFMKLRRVESRPSP